MRWSRLEGTDKENINKDTLLATLYYLYVVDVYKSGKEIGGVVWKWKNPLSWVVAPLVFLVAAWFNGYTEAVKNKHNLGFGLPPYWEARKEHLVRL